MNVFVSKVEYWFPVLIKTSLRQRIPPDGRDREQRRAQSDRDTRERANSFLVYNLLHCGVSLNFQHRIMWDKFVIIENRWFICDSWERKLEEKVNKSFWNELISLELWNMKGAY